MRKRICFLAMVLAATASVSMAALTNPYIPTQLDVATMTWDMDGVGTTSFAPRTVVQVGNTVRFGATMQSGDGSGDGWAYTIWGVDAPVTDLSSYDGYALRFENTDDDTLYVNLYIETGPADTAYETSWVKLYDDQTATLELDFTGVGVANLDDVQFIGIQIGAQMEYGSPRSDDNPSNPDHVSVSVVPIPAPGAILLGSLGAGLVGWLRRRRAF